MSGNALLDELTPTPEDLADWKGLESVGELDAPLPAVQRHLQLAAAMFLLASGATSLPDPHSPLGIVIKSGILDMTWFIGTTKDNQDEIFSPFSSETLGSYRYTKAMSAARQGDDTGVPFFDMALKWLRELIAEGDAGAVFGTSSEHVFSQPYGGTPRRLASLVFPLASPEDSSDEDNSVVDYIALFEEGG